MIVAGGEQRDTAGRFQKGNRWAWKPGQSGNPDGRAKGIVSPSYAIRQLSQATEDEVRAIADDPTEPVAARMAAMEWLVALENGKAAGASRDRLLGRVDGPVRADEDDDVRDNPATQVRVIVEGSVKEVRDETDE